MARKKKKRKKPVKRRVVGSAVTYPNAPGADPGGHDRRRDSFPGDTVAHVAPGRGFRRPIGRQRELTD